MTLNKLFSTHQSIIILSVIWLLAFILRTYHLGALPFNLMEDEVLSGYIGRYILQNGLDLYGNTWPFWYFDKFGDYYIIGPMYLAGISTYIFGINEFAVRFPTAFFGSLIVFPVFVLSNLIFNKKIIAFFASFLIAITPWHIALSRSTVEGIIGSTIFLSGICFLLLFGKRLKIKFLVITTVLFFMSYMVYHPFRMYVPLVFLPVPFLFQKLKQSKKMLVQLIIVCLGFVILTVYISTTPWGSGRLEQTSIFSPLAGVERRIQEQIFATGEGKIFQARVFHNKVIGYSKEFITQYLSYFSPNFLFTSFGAESRYDIPDQGLLYYTYLLLLVMSIIPIKTASVLINKNAAYYFIFLVLIAPIPAALTYYGSPNIHRSVLLSSLLAIPIALGLYKLWLIPFKRIITIGLFSIIFTEFLFFWHQYSVQSDVFTSLHRNDGYREMIKYVIQVQGEYDQVIIPAQGTTAIYYLFYSQIFDAAYAGKFQKDVRIDSIGKVQFVNESCPDILSSYPNGNILLVHRYDCSENTSLESIKQIRGKNDLLGFRLYSNK
ncbi:hypothetical protein CO051_04320 [Candidatus Roizmanbacteria bacterium CG_4_9_14_0_2_um_filter_39_13]|uniref:Glycosyltransferase RgtA/B/C/D-like domain-containing protein n=1 Tax=Candidatus Roizmanbacteria bacterium CG_4_9_14_0_2_um_filter_39_13 TaxID=1974839 RepID=A0A2M8EY62_9BACT|nr:MAG: hypothetical protein COY15_04225 [Candidatus Roizmanbacteria bacterium CG_4_10_14_0_2_um_filter_39_12]PJC31252.1 MAG: hypothetical protein CO051_04320 [Candidatus Roizmanbacteria bacterium CG_4_9_14_0_2_um_filter_39_13]